MKPCRSPSPWLFRDFILGTRKPLASHHRPLLSQKLSQADLRLATPLTSACIVAAIVVKDLTEGNGRVNVSLGALTTVFGLGAALSQAIAGLVVQTAGYDAAFLSVGAGSPANTGEAGAIQRVASFTAV